MQLLYASGGFVFFGFFVCFNSGKRKPKERVFLLTLSQSVLHAQQWISNLLGDLSRDSDLCKSAVSYMGTELPLGGHGHGMTEPA